MKKLHLFRSRLFGGYNKQDVARYVVALEEEIEKLENENIELKKQLEGKMEENGRYG